MTAQEIYRALRKNGKKSRRMICFFRELIDIDELDSKYRETENIDEIQHLSTELKNDLRQSIDSSDIYTYQVSLFLRKRINPLYLPIFSSDGKTRRTD